MAVECVVINRNAGIEVLGMNPIHPTGADFLLHRASGELKPRFVEPDTFLGDVGNPDEHGGRVGDLQEACLAFAQCRFRQHAAGDVGSFHQDAGDGTRAVFDGLIDEVDIPFVNRTAVRIPQFEPDAVGGVGSAAAPDLVQQLDLALHRRLRQDFSDGASRHVPQPQQPNDTGVCQFDSMLRSTQQRREARRLLEKLRQPFAFFGDAPSSLHLFGGFAANHQDAADAGGRTFVIDRTVAVGPIDIFEPAVTRDGNQRVFLPGSSGPGHHHCNLRPDDGPDLLPHLTRRTAERSRVALPADQLTI